MTTLSAPEKTTATEHPYRANGHVGLLTREEVAQVEAEIAVILAPAKVAAPALPSKRSLLALLLQPVLALWDGIAGPAMTARDRNARDLAEAKHHCYPGMGGL